MKKEDKTCLMNSLLWGLLYICCIWSLFNLVWIGIPIGILAGIIYALIFKKLGKNKADILVSSVGLIFAMQLIFQNWFYAILTGLTMWLTWTDIMLKEDFYIKKINISKLVMPILCTCIFGVLLFNFLDLKWIGVCIAVLLGLVYGFIRDKFDRYKAGAFWTAMVYGVSFYVVLKNVIWAVVLGVMWGFTFVVAEKREQGKL